MTDPNPDNLDVFANLVIEAVKSENWALVAILGVVLVVWVLRKFGGSKIKFLRTQRGGAVLSLVAAAVGAVATTLLTGGAFTWALALKALGTAFIASGGWTLVKHILVGDAQQVIEVAEAAGAEAAEAAQVKGIKEFINGGDK